MKEDFSWRKKDSFQFDSFVCCRKRLTKAHFIIYVFLFSCCCFSLSLLCSLVLRACPVFSLLLSFFLVQKTSATCFRRWCDGRVVVSVRICWEGHVAGAGNTRSSSTCFAKNKSTDLVSHLHTGKGTLSSVCEFSSQILFAKRFLGSGFVIANSLLRTGS